MDARAQDILGFWIEEVGASRWYSVEPDLDRAIGDRFGALWEEARAGRLDGWTCGPESCLAYLILLDQFPRNMFRGDARAFATDRKALAAAKDAIDRGFDRRAPVPERQFFYLPLMHSEALPDQDRCVRLIFESFGRDESLLHARAHREIIRRYGRFPYRNEALGRASTPAERDFLAAGGYGAMLEELVEAGGGAPSR
jgi:uncharacterized protein (DUF924 family)